MFSAVESSREVAAGTAAAAIPGGAPTEGDSLTMRSQEGLPLAARQLVSSIRGIVGALASSGRLKNTILDVATEALN